VTKAGIAELKNNLSRYINVVRGGGEVVVLDRDTPVARIVPFDRRAGDLPAAGRGTAAPDDERLAELERQGVIRRGDTGAVRDWQKTRKPVRLGAGGGSVVETLLRMRREDER
jgi:prevent-host-death family protein